MPSTDSNPQPSSQEVVSLKDWFGEFQVVEETITIPSHWMTLDLNVIAQAFHLEDLANILSRF
jgi:thiamine biosynthesis lipoprotein ApbE